MKKKAFWAFLLYVNLVNANDITVYGYGVDRESAKQDAFRTAIENVCGTAVLSDREHKNDNTTYNNISTYSSCRVEKYKILEDNGDRLKMNITVSDSKISSRLYNTSNNKQFDGETLRAQVFTLKEEQKKGDQFIDQVFRDYPYRAFKLNKTKDPYVISDNKRNLYLMIPYDVGWNYNFITAMNETFKLLDTNKGSSIITVMAKDPDSFLFGHKNNYVIDDLSRLNYIKEKLTYQNEVRVKVVVKNSKDQNIINICESLEYKPGAILYSIGIDGELTIFGNDRNKGIIQIKLTSVIESIDNVHVNIAAAKDC